MDKTAMLLMLILPFIAIMFLGPNLMSSVISEVVGDVSYEEAFELNNGIDSINYERNTDKSSYFLGIGGTITEDRLSITLDNGNTIKPDMKRLSFKINEDWGIVEKGIKKVEEDSKEELSRTVTGYTILGNKEDITKLVADLTKTFDREFTVVE